MSSKPTYVEVMRHLAQYATDNLNMDLWRDDDKRKLLASVPRKTSVVTNWMPSKS